MVAIKELKPSDKWRLNREIHMLQIAQDIPQAVKFYGAYGDEMFPSLVTDFGSSVAPEILQYEDVQWVMKELFTALDILHKKRIFHRDIKLGNMLVDFPNKTVKIIDEL